MISAVVHLFFIRSKAGTIFSGEKIMLQADTFPNTDLQTQRDCSKEKKPIRIIFGQKKSPWA
jgi:hypothetical protein